MPDTDDTPDTGDTPGTPDNHDTPPAPGPVSPWEAAARALLDARLAKLPEPFRELVSALPEGTPPGRLVRFVEQAEKAAAGSGNAAGPGEPVPPRATDSRRPPVTDSARADEHLWNELMKDGRRALELKRRRPDLYDALRRRHGGRRPNHPGRPGRKDS